MSENLNRITQRTMRLGAAGPAAATLFAVSVIGFAAVRDDGYSHATKAISELGAKGADNAFMFNLSGFIGPGILIVVLAVALHIVAAAHHRSRTGPALVALSGLAMIMAGVFPVDMADRTATYSVLHLTGAMLSGGFWAISLFWFKPLFAQSLGAPRLARATPWFVLFLIANIGWQVAWQATGIVLPGWGQRIGFAGYFLWLAFAGIILWRARFAQTPG